MPGASWMSCEQSTWLSEKMDGFQLSQLQGNVSTYFSEVNAQWFMKWPKAMVHFKDETGIGLTEEQLSEEQHITLGHHLKRCKAISQLHSYFYHNTLAIGHARVTHFTKTITKLMGSSTDHTCGLSAMENFLHTEYQSGTLVKEEIKAHLKNGEYTRQNCMSRLHAEAVKAMTARGEEYVKKMELQAKTECECHAEKAKAELDALCNPDELAHVQYIEGLSAVVGQLLQTIQETTGWYGSIYLGGPDLRVAGDVCVFSFHHGKGSTGLGFCEALADHHAHVVEPFTTFLKGAFAAHVLPSQSNTSSVPPDITLLADVQVSYTMPSEDHSIINPHSAVLTQYPHASSTAQSMLPDEIHQLPQDQSFDNSLGLFGASLDPFAMSDDMLYEEHNVELWQTSLPMLPPYPGQLPLLTPPCLPSPAAADFLGPVTPSLCSGPAMITMSPTSETPSLSTMSPAVPSGPAMVTMSPAAPSLPATVTTSPTSEASEVPASVLSSPLPPAVTISSSPLPPTVTVPSSPLPPTVTTPPTSKASQVPVSATSLPLMKMSEPLEDIVNQSVRCSSRTHVPSTHLVEANDIGAHKRV
ncbi:hypothetical protein BDR04DRAFT_1122081 [Suillus decipiens]|nr:hypothetical protein BDR04DRAFT_1122081 [Suillus decipiens]